MTLDDVRQPKPVRVIVIGEKPDIDFYSTKLRQFIESRGYDNAVLQGYKEPREMIEFIIYPGAVNE